MDGDIESSIVILAFTTFVIGLVVGIFLTKFVDMWKVSGVPEASPKQASPAKKRK
jgi:hypothetical protein